MIATYILSQEKINISVLNILYMLYYGYNVKLCQQLIKVLVGFPGFIKLVSKVKEDKYTGIELTAQSCM